MITVITVLGLLLNFFPVESAPAARSWRQKPTKLEYVTPAKVKVEREKIRRRFDRRDMPYSLVGRIVGKVSHGHVNQLLRNWYRLPADARQKIIFMFEDAGLGHVMFLCLYESGANQWDESYSSAIGLYQITPRTAKAHCGIDAPAFESLYDPVDNAACAIQILLDKGVKENLVYGLISYNGKLKSCPAKGYQKCLSDKLKTETDPRKRAAYLGSLMYVPNVLLHQAIGEAFIHRPGHLAKN